MLKIRSSLIARFYARIRPRPTSAHVTEVRLRSKASHNQSAYDLKSLTSAARCKTSAAELQLACHAELSPAASARTFTGDRRKDLLLFCRIPLPQHGRVLSSFFFAVSHKEKAGIEWQIVRRYQLRLDSGSLPTHRDIVRTRIASMPFSPRKWVAKNI